MSQNLSDKQREEFDAWWSDYESSMKKYPYESEAEYARRVAFKTYLAVIDLELEIKGDI